MARGRGQGQEAGRAALRVTSDPNTLADNILQIARKSAEIQYAQALKNFQTERDTLGYDTDESVPDYHQHLLKELDTPLEQSFDREGDWDLTRALIRAYIRAEGTDDDLPLLEMGEFDFATGNVAHNRIGQGYSRIQTLRAWSHAEKYLPTPRERYKLEQEHFDPMQQRPRKGFDNLVNLKEAIALACLQRGTLRGNDSPGWKPARGRMVKIETPAHVPLMHLADLKDKDMIHVRNGYLQIPLAPTQVNEAYLYINRDKVEDIYYGPYRHPMRHPEIPDGAMLRRDHALRLLDPLTVVETTERKL